ncbi:MAG: ClpXP protease specificity-enhancing factor [Candidatus Accumulibacter sp.]|jgi:stringent starvation protein B|nr:ClpXP protease specificity-enhancing factor [Accumulibacter sp.]
MSKNLPSTKPYLIRAIHEWCTDNGFTPYIALQVDSRARVPREYARDGQIVLNISDEATGGLQIGNEIISFQARFSGVARDISFPVGNVTAIYARENGAGMAFEPESAESGAYGAETEPLSGSAPEPGSDPTPPPKRPKLQRIK